MNPLPPAVLAHIETGRMWQLSVERDRLSVERDIAQADGRAADAAQVQVRLSEVQRLIDETDRARRTPGTRSDR